ncbi:WD40 repeat-like protein, partial [Rhizodiscina lignyota]
KDEEEEELEQLVFGDYGGLSNSLAAMQKRRDGHQKQLDRGLGGAAEDEEDEDQFAKVDDADLFYIDSGPMDAGAKAQALVKIADTSDSEDEFAARDPPAWEDSEDERITVSLASVPRLRKLRNTEDEDIVGGKEYIKRLRRQFERLNGRPEWARWAEEGQRKRRSSGDGELDEDELSGDEDVEMELDGEHNNLSVKPLSAMLQDTDSFGPSSEPSRKKRKLQPEVLDIQRLKDIPGSQPSAVTSLTTHPTLPLLLSSGPSSTLFLHHILPMNAADPNPLLTSLHIKHTPLSTTAFHPSPADQRIFLSSRRRYFHVWNLQTGIVSKVSHVYGHASEQRSMETFKISPDGSHLALLGSAKKGGGVVNILDAQTLQWAAQCRVESKGGIADFAWWRDGKGLCILGKNGEVTEWSLEELRTIARWVDEGAVGTAVICLGGKSDSTLGGDRWVAVGSLGGIVNVYDRSTWAEVEAQKTKDNGGVPSQPKPKKMLDQLTTTITHLEISHDGQLLLMASKWKRDALRLVHLPSCTVYRNWPTSGTPLGRVSAVTWAKPHVLGNNAAKEGVVSVLFVANESGKIRMWEVR